MPGRGLEEADVLVFEGDVLPAAGGKKAKLTVEARADLNRVGSLTTLDQQWRTNLRGDDSLVGPRPAGWWTGLHPTACPGAQSDGTLASLPLPVRAATLNMTRTLSLLRAGGLAAAHLHHSHCSADSALFGPGRTAPRPAAHRCWPTSTTHGR